MEKQKARNVWSKQGALGPIYGTKNYMNEKRFTTNEHEFSTKLSKYKEVQSPDFKKWADHDLNEFLIEPKGSTDENANNQSYDPHWELTEPSMEIGIPDFNRYAARKHKGSVHYDRFS